jgi:hypothetical protein
MELPLSAACRITHEFRVCRGELSL